MKCRIKAFGISKDILKAREISVEIPNGSTVTDLKNYLFTQFPQLQELASLYIAVNAAYAPDHQCLMEDDEIALIPPVSGG
jgi:molybdopterin synthase sulfur carrier subunit